MFVLVLLLMVNKLISALESAQSAVISSSLAQHGDLPGALCGFVPPAVAAEPTGTGEPSSRCFHPHRNSRRRTNTFHSFGKVSLLRATRINKHLASVLDLDTMNCFFHKENPAAFSASAFHPLWVFTRKKAASDALTPFSIDASQVGESRTKSQYLCRGSAAHPPVHLLFMVSCPRLSHCMLTCSGRLELWTLRQMVLLGLCQPSVFIIMPLTVFPAGVRARGDGSGCLYAPSVTVGWSNDEPLPAPPRHRRPTASRFISPAGLHRWLTLV